MRTIHISPRDKMALLGIFILITGIGCQTVTNIFNDEGSSSTGSGDPVQIQSGTNDGLLFSDDFSDSGSGWDRYDGSDGYTDYDRGGYRMRVDEDNYDIWANPGRSFADVRIEVNATKIGGSNDNDFGVICRYEDIDNFYVFKISSDGYVGIFKVVDDSNINIISGESMDLNGAVKQGNATNHITAECVGNRLTMYVNGSFVLEAFDNDLTYGDVGLIAGTYSEAGTDILFDDLKVYEP